MPGRCSAVLRAVLVAASFALLAGACTSLGPSAANPPTPVTAPPVPSAILTPIARPAGAATPGTAEWYSAPAPSGRTVTLGVYRPEIGTLGSDAASQTATDQTATESGAAPVTVLVLHGGDGFRRLYEDLAQRYSARGFVAIAGCWFDRTEQPANADAVACSHGPQWKGMSSSSVADVDALVNAALEVPGVDPHRLVIAGHSYGAGVALLRASKGHVEPVISSSGFLASSPLGTAVPLPTDEFAIDHVGCDPRTGDDHPLRARRARLHHAAGSGPGAHERAHDSGQPSGDDLLPDPRRPRVPVATRIRHRVLERHRGLDPGQAPLTRTAPRPSLPPHPLFWRH